MWQHWVNVVAGLFVAVTPWLGLDADVHKWVMVVAGLVVVAVSVSLVMGEKKGGVGM